MELDFKKIWFEQYDSGVPFEINPDAFSSLPAMVLDSVARIGDHSAAICAGVETTYRDLDGVSLIGHGHQAVVRMQVNGAIFNLDLPSVKESSQTHLNPAPAAATGGRLDDFHLAHVGDSALMELCELINIKRESVAPLNGNYFNDQFCIKGAIDSPCLHRDYNFVSDAN